MVDSSEEIEIQTLLGSSIDHKNIELAKILFSLRHDLDIHCLIGVNAARINENSPGKLFLGHISMRVLEAIVLAICKVYEKESHYELNSIQGVINSLAIKTAVLYSDEKTVREFIARYGGPSDDADLLASLQETFNNFTKNYADELERFKRARDKIVAHSEFGAAKDPIPSFDTMENLFFFGADFYMVVSDSSIGSGPVNLRNRREIKTDFKKVLERIGLEDIKTEMN